jgi:3-hydroxyisobutyrate dehydrogenase
MSQNLKKNGFAVKGYDIMPEARKTAEENGIPIAATLGEAVKDVDFVITALPQTAHVEESLKMEGGIFASAK